MWSINSSSTGQSTSIGDGWQGAKCVLGSGEKCSSRCISRASSLPEGLSSDAEGGRSGRWQTGEQKVVHRGEGWMPDAGRRREEREGPFLLLHARGNAEALKWRGAAAPSLSSHSPNCRLVLQAQPTPKRREITFTAPQTVESLWTRVQFKILSKGLQSCPAI